MAFAPSLSTTFLLIATVCILLPQAHAFGAGDIPDFAYLNDKAFRHGDIESILENLAKTAGGAAIGGSGILGFAASVVKAAAGPSKFSKSDIKKVYFGNWLRDYSQAMDIAGLSKLSADTLVLVVSVLGFMTFGFSTEEFEVTAERLGVYLPVEHIDNPKGYAEKEGDARQFHKKLRPPVERKELEIDPRTGMKKYMATENEGFDTSTAFIRRTLKSCIEHGRRAQGKEGAVLWEAYRLLGTGLHTLEDFTAHSNWCEIALRKMGHEEVFCHVGDRVTVNTPSGPAPPLVTGTFGGADFLHSLLGEAGDKLSQASVTDLTGKLDQASGKKADLGPLKGLLGKIMGGSEQEEKLNQGQQMHQQAQGYHFNPDNVAPPEVQKQLLDLLKWHDDVMRSVIKKISMVPGLSDLLEEFSNALNAYIYTVLAPYLTPILTQATSALNEGSKAVIDNHDQYEVFDNPNASDPSHSLLSKDHFGLILNEPAGKIAQIVVENSVNEIVQAWSSDENPDQVLNRILEAFHHPYYSTGQRGSIQHKMFEAMQKWLGGLGPDDARQTIQALTKESVRNHKNKRLGSDEQSFDEPGYGSCGHGQTKRPTGGISTGTNSKPAYNAEVQSGGYGSGRNQQSSSNYQQSQSGYGGGRQESSGYGGRQEGSGYGDEQESTTYGGRMETSSGYGGRQESTTYGGRTETTSGYGGRQEPSSYGGRTETSVGYGGRTETPAYGGRTETSGYVGRNDPSSGYGGRNETSTSYGGRTEASTGYGDRTETASGYGARTEPSSGYGGRTETSGYGRTESLSGYGGQTAATGYGGRNESSGYGSKRDDDDKPKFGGGFGGSNRRNDDDDDKPKFGGGGGYGSSHARKDSDDEKPKYGGGGYGGSQRRKDSDDEKPKYGGGSYGRKDDDDDKPKYGGGGYGQRRKDSDDDDKPKYGGGGYGQRRKDSDDEKPKYGGGGSRRNDSDDDKPKPKYGGGGGAYGGSQRRKDSDDDKPKYGGGGYGGSQRRKDSDDEKPKYGARGGTQYRKESEDSDDEKKKRNKYGSEQQHSGYAPSYQSGYAPSYGGGSQSQTYGVERMKVRDDDSDDEKRRRQGGGGYGGGYGGGRY